MVNPVKSVNQEIQRHCLNKVNDSVATLLIRYHNQKLKENGDISFPSNANVWKKHQTVFLLPSSTDLVIKSKDWKFPLEAINLQGERYILHLQRLQVTAQLIRAVLNKGNDLPYGYMFKNPARRIHQLATNGDENNLTYYRTSLIHQTLKRVLEYSEYTCLGDQKEKSEDIFNVEVLSVLTSKPSGTDLTTQYKTVTIHCGIVMDSKTGKLATISTRDYIDLRTNDQNLLALHKYGIRAKEQAPFVELMKRLGVAAVTVDLLEKKCSSPATTIRNGQGSNTKGASFILYNSARLETLLNTFEERVSKEEYKPLPPIEEIDFSLLNSEDEWQLIFVYIFSFPELINRCLCSLESGKFASHLIVQFLSGLVGTFSVYYRRSRILTEYRLHLMPQLYARIYLLLALRDVFNKTLALLNIQPVPHM